MKNALVNSLGEYWQQVIAATEVGALHILAEMCAAGVEAGEGAEMPPDVMGWYAQKLVCDLVLGEHALEQSGDPRVSTTVADLATRVADMCNFLCSSDLKEHRAYGENIMAVLTLRPVVSRVVDDTYGGRLPAPARIIVSAGVGHLS